MQIVILGAGLIGNPMARDLAQDSDKNVLIVDRDAQKLKELEKIDAIDVQVADATDPLILKELISDAAVVINALPGFLGYQTLKHLLELGKNVVDIAFFPEDALALQPLALKNQVTALVDCGVAPGMSNLLVGYGQSLLKKVEEVKIYVGGLPRVRQLPWEYKAVFSPIDVIEEYTRPARFKKDGKIVVKEPLTDPEFIDFPQVGTLEAFNSDGLRTLLYTIDAPDMVEKTLRYPGHREKVLFLKQTGLLDEAPLEINGQKIRPIDLTCQTLFKQWQLKPGEEDLTVMRVEVRGPHGGLQFDLLDFYDAKSGIHSMARTTGYTATIMARAMLNGLIAEKGILPLEQLGHNHELVRFVFNEFHQRGIHYQQTEI
ncbi:saccharopine dehydrogenase family protein [Calditrichota bacterium GD2]